MAFSELLDQVDPTPDDPKDSPRLGSGLRSPISNLDVRAETDRFESRLKPQVERMKLIDDAQKDAVTSMIAKGDELLDRMMKIETPAPPKLKEIPDAPHVQYSDPMQALGSMGTILAVIGSLKTRAPMTSALNAAAASMEAFHKGDKEGVKRQREIWNDDLTKALRQNQEELAQYQAALHNANFDLNKTAAQWRVIAAQNQNHSMLAAIESRDPERMYQLYTDSAKIGTEMLKMQASHLDREDALKQSQQRFEESRQDRKDTLAETRRHHKAIEEAKSGGAGGPQGPLDEIGEKALEIQAWNFINTKNLPYRKGTGGGKDRNDAVVRKAAEISQQFNMTPEQMSSLSAEFKSNAQSLAFQTKKLDAIGSQLESFHNNIDTWESIAAGVAPKLGGDKVKDFAPMLEKVNFVGVRAIDDVKLRIQQQFNDPSVSALMVSAMAVAMDYARIMQGPQSIASLTEGARKDAERLVAASADEKGRKGIIAALESDTAGQVKGLEDQAKKIRSRMRIGGAADREAPAGDASTRAADDDLINKYLK